MPITSEYIDQLKQLAAGLECQAPAAFLADKVRNARLRYNLDGLFIDASKQLLDSTSLDLLVAFAEHAQLAQKIQDCMHGAVVNPSEGRAALHTLLRAPAVLPATYAASSLALSKAHAGIQATLAKIKQITEQIHTGQWRGVTGSAITDVVNLGVGGSELGPNMVVQALGHLSTSGLNVHFASSIDGSQLAEILPNLRRETTIFIYSSKSFTTVDTASNAETALSWLCNHNKYSEVLIKRHHFIGVSTRDDLMTAWGIHPAHQLNVWDFVGGRFSLWSAIGLPIALKIGYPQFAQLLAGAHSMDTHFATQPLAANVPVLLALIDFWNFSVLEREGHAVLPYDGRLKQLPSYLTQLEMESNGKSTTLGRQRVTYRTCPILWGDVGSNAQHAFFQLLHQGTSRVALDFIVPVSCDNNLSILAAQNIKAHTALNLANCLAQSQLLFLGDQDDYLADDNAVFKSHLGKQPSTTILLDTLDAITLGKLLALYEHKVFALSVLWDINPFDQWGVEKGKIIAQSLMPIICDGGTVEHLDDSSASLLQYIFKQNVEPS